MTEKADILRRVCAALAAGDSRGAGALLHADYPFVPTETVGRRYTELQSLRVFWRDGFVDRYAGTRLVFPGTLRLLSQLLPAEFPAHPTWKMSATHFAFWELFPTIDHVVPVARGGADEESNWVCTSMLRNSAKSNWSLGELGWTLVPAGNSQAWDGLTRWYCDAMRREPARFADAYLRRWYVAAEQVLAAS